MERNDFTAKSTKNTNEYPISKGEAAASVRDCSDERDSRDMRDHPAKLRTQAGPAPAVPPVPSVSPVADLGKHLSAPPGPAAAGRE